MQDIWEVSTESYSNSLFIYIFPVLCVLGKFSMTFSFPRSQWLKTKVSLKFLLAITWLLEGLSKQSLGFVNSEGYLAIEASRWRLSQTTCYGNAFAVRAVWKYSDPGSLFLLLPPIHTQANMIGAKKEKPFKHSSNFPSVSFPLPHVDPPSLSPDFARRTKQLDREGFPAGPDLSHKKDDTSFEETGQKGEEAVAREKT